MNTFVEYCQRQALKKDIVIVENQLAQLGVKDSRLFIETYLSNPHLWNQPLGLILNELGPMGVLSAVKSGFSKMWSNSVKRAESKKFKKVYAAISKMNKESPNDLRNRLRGQDPQQLLNNLKAKFDAIDKDANLQASGRQAFGLGFRGREAEMRAAEKQQQYDKDVSELAKALGIDLSPEEQEVQQAQQAQGNQFNTSNVPTSAINQAMQQYNRPQNSVWGNLTQGVNKIAASQQAGQAGQAAPQQTAPQNQTATFQQLDQLAQAYQGQPNVIAAIQHLKQQLAGQHIG